MSKLKILLPLLVMCSRVASADSHLPSPCADGEPGAGANCMYLVGAGGSYDSVSGERSVSINGLTVELEVWIDFGTIAVQGGGFDLAFDTALVTDATWQWDVMIAGDATLNGEFTAGGYTGIQFDDFAGNGFGGTTGTKPGFARVGILTLTLSQSALLAIAIEQPYSTNTYPNCFAPGAGSGGSGCVVTGFFGLAVTANAPVDSDEDGVLDFMDNCTQVANADQRDSNADGFGNQCDGDFNNDCETDLTDLSILRSVFLTGDADGDLNGDGTVDLADLAGMRPLFLLPPGPSGLAGCP
ncbi:MAG: hypothetical protein HKO55_10840 [Gammaproteobacteria bacterium]|nr:hypothetical protein [Gammaproteobacteria bacterium]